MSVLAQMNLFADRYGKKVVIHNTTWRYYRLGEGSPILWLTGGLRRSALGFAFMERLARNHTVIAPNYPPVQTIDEFITAVMQNELSRADVVSHFAVAADLIKKGLVTPAVYQSWTGRIIVLSAENDPTQSKKDLPHYEKLFGRAVEVVNMGNMGHTAALVNPDKYVELIEKALN
jgi:pimeloyl-ACP methyl ester carboxylesterase